MNSFCCGRRSRRLSKSSRYLTTGAPALLPRDEFLISTFANAIKILKATLTKPAAKFVAAADMPHFADDLEMIANFMNQVAAAIKRKTAA